MRGGCGFYAVNQVVTYFLFVDCCALFTFSYAFCGANWVARFEISDHGNVGIQCTALQYGKICIH
jgi:hypothetical protein